jgi:hypothetical protein
MEKIKKIACRLALPGFPFINKNYEIPSGIGEELLKFGF